MEQRRFPPPPPRPQTHLSEETTQEEPTAQQAQPARKGNLRLILLIVGAVVAFIGATVCGYFLFG